MKDEENSEKDFHKNLKQLGHLVPETEEEVKQFEKKYDESKVVLPEPLRDPFAIFKKKNLLETLKACSKELDLRIKAEAQNAKKQKL